VVILKDMAEDRPDGGPARTSIAGPTVTWFELFYDLVVVAAVSLCNDAYLTRPSLGTALAALLSMAALSWVWFLTTLFNNFFPGDDLARRLLLLGQMAALVIAALSVDQFEGLSNATGLIAYAVALLIVGLLVLRSHRGPLRVAVLKGSALAIGVPAAVCVIGSQLPDKYAGLVLAAALAVSIGTVLTARLPANDSGSVLRVDHLRERRGLFILIILGEGFAGLVQTLHHLGSIPRGGVFALTFVLSFALWWIYFDGTFAERPGQVIVRWRLSLLAHLTLIYGMAGTLDLLVLLTAQEEAELGDSSLLYFALSLATVFFSFAVLGFTVLGRLGTAGLVQIASGIIVVVAGLVVAQGEEASVRTLMIAASILVVGNALFAVWTERATDSGGWRSALRRVAGSEDGVP